MIPTHTVAVFGAAKVGKTSLIKRYLTGTYNEGYTPTVQSYFSTLLRTKTNYINLKIVDMSGHFQFPAMRRLAIQEADSFMIVYSLTDGSSIRAAVSYRNEIEQVLDKEHFPVLFVGNKSDGLDQRQLVDARELQDAFLGEDGNLTGIAIASAKEGTNVNELFPGLLKLSGADVYDVSNDRKKSSGGKKKKSHSIKGHWKAILKVVTKRLSLAK